MRKISTRIQLEAAPERIAELEALMAETSIRTKADLLNEALTLFEWAITESKRGRVIGSMEEATKQYKQVLLPSLQRALTRSSQRAKPTEEAPMTLTGHP